MRPKPSYRLLQFLCLACAASGWCQPLLTADEALAIALKNNYDILVAHNDAQIAKVNNTPGNAGMLPSIAVTASDNYASQISAYQRGTAGVTIDSVVAGNKFLTRSVADTTTVSNIGSNAAGASVALSWTVLDGGKMFITKRKLGELEILGGIQFRQKVLQTAYNVMVAYYDVVRQKQQLASLKEVLSYNGEQVKILQTSFGAGLSPKTNLLQAEIDLNVFKENALAQETVIRDAKRALNLLLSRNPDALFEVVDSITLTYAPDKARLLSQIGSSNVDIAAFQKQVEVARLSLQEARSQFFPRLSISAGLGLSRADYGAGSVLTEQGYGPQVGGALTIPLYQAGNALRQVKTSRLILESSSYALESEKQLVASELSTALDEFENQRELLAIEKVNDALAKENLDISMERLRLGQSTSLELRQAQESYEDSRTRLINIEFNLKAAETKLRQLIAEL